MILHYQKRKIIISATCHGAVLQALLLKSSSFAERYECEFIANYQVGQSGIERSSNESCLSVWHRLTGN